MTCDDRRKEIRQIHKDYKWLYALLFCALALGVGVGIAASEFADDSRGFWMNVVTEGLGVAASVVITVFVIDRLYERREKERQKARLKREASSRVNDIALSSVDVIRAEGWLEGPDGILQRADFERADLRRAGLEYANLLNVFFFDSDLENTCLVGANLQGARISRVNMRGAGLICADLRGAKLSSQVSLQDASLVGADLRGVSFEPDFVRLPDGTLYNQCVDMRKFTDPTHPEFFEPPENSEHLTKAAVRKLIIVKPVNSWDSNSVGWGRSYFLYKHP